MGLPHARLRLLRFRIVANDGTHLEIEVKTTVNDYEQPTSSPSPRLLALWNVATHIRYIACLA